jgi:hypothetical protein
VESNQRQPAMQEEEAVLFAGLVFAKWAATSTGMGTT